MTGALLWFFKIEKVTPFEYVEVFCKDSFLVVCFFLFINDLSASSCHLPLSLLFMMTTWPFSPHLPRPLPRWRLHKNLCFDCSAGLGTGVFSIRANARSPFSWLIPTKVPPSPLLVQLSLPLNRTPTFLWVTFDRTLFFLNIYFS